MEDTSIHCQSFVPLEINIHVSYNFFFPKKKILMYKKINDDSVISTASDNATFVQCNTNNLVMIGCNIHQEQLSRHGQFALHKCCPRLLKLLWASLILLIKHKIRH